MPPSLNSSLIHAFLHRHSSSLRINNLVRAKVRADASFCSKSSNPGGEEGPCRHLPHNSAPASVHRIEQHPVTQRFALATLPISLRRSEAVSLDRAKRPASILAPRRGEPGALAPSHPP